MRKLLAMLVSAILALSAGGAALAEQATEAPADAAEQAQAVDAPETDATGTLTTGMANPMVGYDDIAAVNAAVGLGLALPSEAEDVALYVIDSETAQADFTLKGMKYSYRACKSAEATDITGLFYDNWDEQTTLNYSGRELNINYMSAVCGAATWYDADEGVQYSLTMGEDVDMLPMVTTLTGLLDARIAPTTAVAAEPTNTDADAAIDTEASEPTEADADAAIDTEASEPTEADADAAIDTEAAEPTDTDTDAAIDTEAAEPTEADADAAIDTEAAEPTEADADAAIDSTIDIGMPNPVKGVADVSMLNEKLGLDMFVPTLATNVGCQTIGTLGQVNFTLNGYDFNYRALKCDAPTDISGIYCAADTDADTAADSNSDSDELQEHIVEIGYNDDLNYNVHVLKGYYGYAQYYNADEGVQYSLSMGEEADPNILLSTLAALMKHDDFVFEPMHPGPVMFNTEWANGFSPAQPNADVEPCDLANSLGYVYTDPTEVYAADWNGALYIDLPRNDIIGVSGTLNILDADGAVVYTQAMDSTNSSVYGMDSEYLESYGFEYGTTIELNIAAQLEPGEYEVTLSEGAITAVQLEQPSNLAENGIWKLTIMQDHDKSEYVHDGKTWSNGKSAEKPFEGAEVVDLTQTLGYIALSPDSLEAAGYTDVTQLEIYLPRTDVTAMRGMLGIYSAADDALVAEVDLSTATVTALEAPQIEAYEWETGTQIVIPLDAELTAGEYYVNIPADAFAATYLTVPSNPLEGKDGWSFVVAAADATDAEPAIDADATDAEPAIDADATDAEPVADADATDAEPVADADATDAEPVADADATDAEPVADADATDTTPAIINGLEIPDSYEAMIAPWENGLSANAPFDGAEPLDLQMDLGYYTMMPYTGSKVACGVNEIGILLPRTDITGISGTLNMYCDGKSAGTAELNESNARLEPIAAELLTALEWQTGTSIVLMLPVRTEPAHNYFFELSEGAIECQYMEQPSSSFTQDDLWFSTKRYGIGVVSASFNMDEYVDGSVSASVGDTTSAEIVLSGDAVKAVVDILTPERVSVDKTELTESGAFTFEMTGAGQVEYSIVFYGANDEVLDAINERINVKD